VKLSDTRRDLDLRVVSKCREGTGDRVAVVPLCMYKEKQLNAKEILQCSPSPSVIDTVVPSHTETETPTGGKEIPFSILLA
jgi:hypothetical protein